VIAPASKRPPLPRYVQLYNERPLTPAIVDAAHRGVYEVRSVMTEVIPPVNWHMDPVENRSWRFWLHTMQFMETPLRLYAETHDVEALKRAVAIGLDWLHSNPVGADSLPDFAWYDMATGIRAPFLAFTWRAALSEHLLTSEQDAAFRTGLRAHGDWLLDPHNYTAHSNHGLYEDAGLYLMAGYCEDLPESAAWRAGAERRFIDTLETHVQPEEGLHLEHSPDYHAYVGELLDRLVATGIGGSRTAVLLDRMRRAAPWTVMPDGRLVPFGDTNCEPAPAFAGGRQEQGLGAFLRAGMAFVRHGDSYLAVTGGYHTVAHKHGDELSWCLCEDGRLLVGEAGRWGFRSEQDPQRIYARSSQGHNTLVLDDETFPWFAYQGREYGSALNAAGAGHGWYVIAGQNPLLKDAEHERFICYRPAELLVIIDRLTTGEVRTVHRRVHAAAGIGAASLDHAVLLTDEDGADLARLRDWSDVDVDLSIVHGQSEPTVEGWTYLLDMQEEPVFTMIMACQASACVLVHSLEFTETPISRLRVQPLENGFELSIDRHGPESSYRLTRHEASIAVTRGS
jgi:hypothetical protein